MPWWTGTDGAESDVDATQERARRQGGGKKELFVGIEAFSVAHDVGVVLTLRLGISRRHVCHHYAMNCD